MTEEGWIKQHRSIFFHWVNEDHRAFHLWSYLIAEVNYVEKKTMIEGDMMTIAIGQTVTSIDQLSKAVGVTWRKTKTLLDAFEKDDMITTEKVGKNGILLTVCNYEEYQSALSKRRAERRTESRAERRTNDRANDRTERTQHKKDKNSTKKTSKENKNSAQGASVDLWGRRK